jgi:uncharacterized lipoprotein
MPLRLLLCLALLVLASACSHDEAVRCPGSGTDYLSAISTGELRIPDDLSVPDETEALQIPAPAPPPEDADSVECLQYSPAFLQEAEESEQD